jgi:hypothetical protein
MGEKRLVLDQRQTSLFDLAILHLLTFLGFTVGGRALLLGVLLGLKLESCLTDDLFGLGSFIHDDWRRSHYHGWG